MGRADRAALRATCADARRFADALQDTVLLPLRAETLALDSAGSAAAYHLRLGAVAPAAGKFKSMRVQYNVGAGDEARALSFLEAYRAALGADLPASVCTVEVSARRQLPARALQRLLLHVAPGVEGLRVLLPGVMGSASADNLTQLLEQCMHMRSLCLQPSDAASMFGMRLFLRDSHLLALSSLTQLHTLSGPWVMDHSALQRLCDALPHLATLGFRELDLRGATHGACISRTLHTLAAWRCTAGAPRALEALGGCTLLVGEQALLDALPGLQRLEALTLCSSVQLEERGAEACLSAAQAAVRSALRRARSAGVGVWSSRRPHRRQQQHAACMGAGSSAPASGQPGAAAPHSTAHHG